MMPKYFPYGRVEKVAGGFEVSCATDYWDTQDFNAIFFSHILQLLRVGERLIEEPDIFSVTEGEREQG